MPKKEINYGETYIYKICCKDTDINDVYIGHTTNITKRKYQHKHICLNPDNINHNVKVYEYIRNNGGWENWDLIIVEKFSCNNFEEAKQKERYYIETLKATLNNNIPIITNEERKNNMIEYNKKYSKDYYITNKDLILKKTNDYYYNNIDLYKAKRKKFYDENKETIHTKRKEYFDQYRSDNKEKLCEKKSCECGAVISKNHFSRHLQSFKHINYLQKGD